jgi:hypothetical protein
MELSQAYQNGLQPATIKRFYKPAWQFPHPSKYDILSMYEKDLNAYEPDVIQKS